MSLDKKGESQLKKGGLLLKEKLTLKTLFAKKGGPRLKREPTLFKIYEDQLPFSLLFFQECGQGFNAIGINIINTQFNHLRPGIIKIRHVPQAHFLA